VNCSRSRNGAGGLRSCLVSVQPDQTVKKTTAEQSLQLSTNGNGLPFRVSVWSALELRSGLHAESGFRIRVRVRMSRVSCRVSADFRINEKPGMMEPRNGGPKSFQRGMETSIQRTKSHLVEDCGEGLCSAELWPPHGLAECSEPRYSQDPRRRGQVAKKACK